MSKSNTFENALLLLLYNNTDIANLGDASGVQGSAAAGTLQAALHSSDPGEAGTQSTNEVSYTGYARANIARSGAGFTVSGNEVSNAAEVDFGTCTAGSATATHVSFGYNGTIMHSGALTSSVAIGTGNPDVKAAIGDLTVTED